MKKYLQASTLVLTLLVAGSAFASSDNGGAQNDNPPPPMNGGSGQGGFGQGRPGGHGGPREACHADADKFCPDTQPGGGRIMSCLEDHYKELSDDCYSALQKAQSHKGRGGGGQAGQGADNDNRNDQPPPPPPEDEQGGNNMGGPDR